MGPKVCLQLVRNGTKPASQEAELRLKQWLQSTDEDIEVLECETRLDFAAQKLRNAIKNSPETAGLLIALEYNEDELPVLDELSDRMEIIGFRQNFETDSHFEAHAPASKKQTKLRVEEVRKSLLRLKWKLRGLQIRLLTAQDLEAYFRLRYEVYNKLKFLPEQALNSKGLEVHFSDRWSMPMGAFLGNEMVGCGRLVAEFGASNAFEAAIDGFVKGLADDDISRSWQIKSVFPHPFDLLAPFSDFEDYYQRLVVKKVRKAELSRIIVKPKKGAIALRKQGLGELIVDSLITEAAQRNIHLLFLACQKKHKAFYERSEFCVIPNMICDRFGEFPVPAIAMERWLQ